MVDQHVLTQRFQCTIVVELSATIVCPGRWREHLDDECRVEQRIAVVVPERGLAADHHDIRIGEESFAADFDPHHAREYCARALPQLDVQARGDIPYDRDMGVAHWLYSDDTPTAILVLALTGTLERQVLLDRHSCIRLCGHRDRLSLSSPDSALGHIRP